MPGISAPDPAPRVPLTKLVVRFAIVFILMPLLFFSTAGTVRWPVAWVYLIGQFMFSVSIVAWLNKNNPDLLRERMTFMKKSGKSWDKPIVLAFTALSVALYALPGLDAVRYHWTYVPPTIQLVAFAGLVAGSALVFRVMQVNTFLTPLVEIQRDRGHTVVSTGPYAYVRHPMYAGMTISMISLPLFLGSLWTLAIAGVILTLLFVRTYIEDRTLHRELPGYAEYAQRVRYRIVPGVW